MSKILLVHNSDKLYKTLKPDDNKRPFFYWYTDRFCSHLGTTKYTYLFVVDPIADGIELRARGGSQDFDKLHKDFLSYRDHCDGKKRRGDYAESGIAMTFSELVPNVVLVAESRGQSEGLSYRYKVLKPRRVFNKSFKLFESPYSRLYSGKPIKFNQIPQIKKLIPDIDSVFPFSEPEHNEMGFYKLDSWLPMQTDKNGSWL